MNDLCCDIGWKSIHHDGEQLCGDHVEIAEQEDGSCVIVLADGLGSGVKASILSTLTSKIISTMLAAGLSLEECVNTIAATLPVDSQRGVAYSTFTILRIIRNQTAEIIQYDNPRVILIRNNESFDYPVTELTIGDKKILRSLIRLQEDDVFVAMSDGCPHASGKAEYNMSWTWEDIVAFMEAMTMCGYTAKSLCTLLVDECDKLYDRRPLDDATACVVRLRKRVPMNILFGPPADRDDENRMMSLFFAKEGKHIICGGTTAKVASHWLRKPLNTAIPTDSLEDSDVPPISKLEGVDLVTEGVLTVGRLAEYAQDYIGENTSFDDWSRKQDGASQMARLLFEEATDISFFVGRAVNPAQQDPDLPFNFRIKMNLVKDLTEALKQMGKRVTVSYF